MNIGKLEIPSFKSFLRPVKIEFSNGVNAIFGQAGTGKTNLLSAIREQVAKKSDGSGGEGRPIPFAFLNDASMFDDHWDSVLSHIFKTTTSLEPANYANRSMGERTLAVVGTLLAV